MAATELMSESASRETQRMALPKPFLIKTYKLVEDPAVDDLISWNEDGSGFIIWRPAEFARDLLPKYFKHNNLSSFVRQLNTYGFRKVVPDRWEFVNDCFKKGEKRLLRDIHRRKLARFAGTSTATALVADVAPATMQLMNTSTSNSGEDQGFSSTSSPGGTVLQQVTNFNDYNTSTQELVEANKRLKKENEQMTNELIRLRGLCNNIFQLMSSYGPSSAQQDPVNPSMVSLQLDLLQSGMFSDEQGCSSSGRGYGGEMDDKVNSERKSSPKLFGVSIRSKRAKISEHYESAQNKYSNAQSEMNLEQSHSGQAHPSST